VLSTALQETCFGYFQAESRRVTFCARTLQGIYKHLVDDKSDLKQWPTKINLRGCSPKARSTS
jgi:hypothetical protein